MAGEYTGPVAPIGATPAGGPSGDQSFWQKFVLPLRPAVEQGMAFASGAPMADDKGKIQPSGIEKFAASQVVPDTATDAALNALMLAFPEGESLESLPPPIRTLLKSRMARIGGMGAAGAGIGAATGEGAGTGALKGALGQAGGEILSSVGKRVLGGNEAARYAQNLGKTVQESFPQIGEAVRDLGINLDDPKALDAAFKAGKDSPVMKHAAEQLAVAKHSVGLAAGNRPLGVSDALFRLIRDNPEEAERAGIPNDPRVWRQLKYDQWDKFLTETRSKAYTLERAPGVGGSPKDALQGRNIRRDVETALGDLQRKLNTIDPGTGDFYRRSQGRFAQTKTITDLFSEKGVIGNDGHIDIPKLQELAKERGSQGWRDELERTPGGKKLLKEIFRKDSPTAVDRPRGGVSIGGEVWPLPIRIHSHVNPFGTTRAGKEAVNLYHGIPAIVAKALAERTGAFGDAE